jgi:hypothetical protein
MDDLAAFRNRWTDLPGYLTSQLWIPIDGVNHGSLNDGKNPSSAARTIKCSLVSASNRLRSLLPTQWFTMDKKSRN